MRAKAIEWNMSIWRKNDDIDYAHERHVDIDWQCIRDIFITQLDNMIDVYNRLNDGIQFKQQFAQISLLDEPLARLSSVNSEVLQRQPPQSKDVLSPQVEVVQISAGFSYEQVLKAAKDQTCNTRCPFLWYYVVAPLIVLPIDLKN